MNSRLSLKDMICSYLRVQQASMSTSPCKGGGRRRESRIALFSVVGIWLAFSACPAMAQAPADFPTNASGYSVAVGQSFRDCEDCPEMVVIPAGTFLMGSSTAKAGIKVPAAAPTDESSKSEQPQHRVEFKRPLAVSKFHVTHSEFARFAQATGYYSDGGCYVLDGTRWKLDASRTWRDPGFAHTDDDPVVCVSWNDAQAYVQWLNRETGQRYRLLTGAEWEYATRAGTATAFWWGNDIGQNHANCNGCGSDRDDMGTSPDGSFKPNPFGLYDMVGNAWQWLDDCWTDGNANAQSGASAAPTSAGNCSLRALRGGSWSYGPQFLSPSFRGKMPAERRESDVGFRVVRMLTETGQRTALDLSPRSVPVSAPAVPPRSSR